MFANMLVWFIIFLVWEAFFAFKVTVSLDYKFIAVIGIFWHRHCPSVQKLKSHFQTVCADLSRYLLSHPRTRPERTLADGERRKSQDVRAFQDDRTSCQNQQQNHITKHKSQYLNRQILRQIESAIQNQTAMIHDLQNQIRRTQYYRPRGGLFGPNNNPFNRGLGGGGGLFGPNHYNAPPANVFGRGGGGGGGGLFPPANTFGVGGGGAFGLPANHGMGGGGGFLSRPGNEINTQYANQGMFGGGGFNFETQPPTFGAHGGGGFGFRARPAYHDIVNGNSGAFGTTGESCFAFQSTSGATDGSFDATGEECFSFERASLATPTVCQAQPGNLTFAAAGRPVPLPLEVSRPPTYNGPYKVPATATLRERLTAFYTEVAPEKVAKVNMLTEKYKTRPEVLYGKLLKQYPTEWLPYSNIADSGNISLSSHRHGPEKLEKARANFAEFHGKDIKDVTDGDIKSSCAGVQGWCASMTLDPCKFKQAGSGNSTHRHRQKPCKFDPKCVNPNCRFLHPIAQAIAQAGHQFGDSGEAAQDITFGGVVFGPDGEKKTERKNT